MDKIIAVVGPTASGKTSLALNIASKYNGEIVSCDSMQLYRGMDIGTAKPDESEQIRIVHHLIDILDITDSYSVSDYVKDAEKCVADILSRKKIPVFCGGTGLYIDSFLSGVEFGEYEIDENIRPELEKLLDDKGPEYMYNQLLLCDEASAKATCPENTKRVLRALEVYRGTGVTLTEWNKRSKINSKEKDSLVIFLDFFDRNNLYSRIDKRVDIMLEQGLLSETERLIKFGLKDSLTAGQAIGYKEFYPYFDELDSLDNCIEILKRNSRRYAKRQLTWFNRNKKSIKIYRDDLDDNEVFQAACGYIDSYLKGEI